MARAITQPRLERETEAYRGSGGISQENGGYGFRPAFLDTESRRVYPCRFADGRPAPLHLIEGLPDELVAARDGAGRVVGIKATVIAGFVLADRFYTRAEAAAFVAARH